jgi:pilus assembly protein Flp/PilA
MSGEVSLAVYSKKSAKLEIITSCNLRSARVFTGRDFGQHRIWRIGVKRFFLKFLSDQSGATAIEYGLIAAGIAIAIITAVNGVGTSLISEFNSISSSLK